MGRAKRLRKEKMATKRKRFPKKTLAFSYSFFDSMMSKSYGWTFDQTFHTFTEPLRSPTGLVYYFESLYGGDDKRHKEMMQGWHDALNGDV